MTSYFRPPDDWVQPSRCDQCDAVIMYGPVIGGHIWMHIVVPDDEHEVVMGRWWDVRTGQWREGSGLAELLADGSSGV